MSELPAWYQALTARPAAEGAPVVGTIGPGDGEPVVIANPAAYAEAALARECDELANMAPDTGRNHQLNKAAFAVGRMLAGGLPVDESEAVDRLLAACEVNGLLGEDGNRACVMSIRSGLKGGAKQPLAWVTAEVPLATPLEVPAGLVVPPSQLDPVAVEAQRQRVTRAARRLVDGEEADAAFSPPVARSLREFLAEPDENVPYLVADVLPHGANATLTAQYKAGKTTMLTNLLRALVDEVPFLGRHNVVGVAGRVAMFDYEMTRTQLRRWLRESKIVNVDAVDVVPLRGLGLALDSARGRAWAVDFLRERNIGVWIVDPFARAYLGDENDNGAVTAWTDALDVIKHDAGVHTLVMAVHTGRAEREHARARGATRLDDWPDVRWLFTKTDDGTRYFAATGRDVEVEEVGLSYNGITRRYTADRPGRRAADFDKNTALLLEVMVPYGAGPGQTKTEIRRLIRRNNDDTTKWLETALSQRRIKQVGDKYWSDIAVAFNPSEKPDGTGTGPGPSQDAEDPPSVGGVRRSLSGDSEQSGDSEGEGA